jgi:hypothetical protein
MEDAFDATKRVAASRGLRTGIILSASGIAVVNADKETMMRMVLLWPLGVPISLLLIRNDLDEAVHNGAARLS